MAKYSSLKFGERFKEFYSKLTKEQKLQLRKELNLVDDGSLQKYMGGRNLPTLDRLITITKFFDVSADYLLGITDEPAIIPEIQAINKKYGLSKEALEKLEWLNLNVASPLNIINELLTTDVGWEVLIWLNTCVMGGSEFVNAKAHFVNQIGNENYSSETMADSEFDYTKYSDKRKQKEVYVVSENANTFRVITTEDLDAAAFISLQNKIKVMREKLKASKRKRNKSRYKMVFRVREEELNNG
jgi:transcriptional regulator with XRE-family HTH domain